MEVGDQLHAPVALPSEKEPLNRRGCYEDVKNIYSSGIRTPILRSSSSKPITMPTLLFSHSLYPNFTISEEIHLSIFEKEGNIFI
jgi:hypothetical protein